MDASYKIQRGIHVHLIQFFMCPEFWVHIKLVYEVPSGFTDFSIAYLEQFVDDSGEESTGETFFVYFTAEDQTGASA